MKIFRPLKFMDTVKFFSLQRTSLHKTKRDLKQALQQQLLGITKLHKINGMGLFAMNKFKTKH